MRFTTPSAVSPADLQQHPIIMNGARGERITIMVLNHGLIRVQHCPDGTPRLDRTWMITNLDGDVPREGRRRDDLSIFPQPPFTLTQTSDSELTLETEQLRLDISTGDLTIRWSEIGGEVFAADLARRAYAYDCAGRSVFHYMERRAGEHYYGFGEAAGTLDKAGMRIRMYPMDAVGYNAESSDPLYKHWPFYITYVPDLKIAYGLLYDNLAPTTFDLGKEFTGTLPTPYRYYHAEDGDLDYYFIYGPTIEAVVEQFASLTGLPMLPPRWTLGYLGSTMKYTEQPDAQAQLKTFVDLCTQHNIPCDMFHLSSGYTTDAEGRRHVFTWNTSRIPDPKAMIETFHQAGIRVAANIKPHLLTTHPSYAEVAGKGGFIRVNGAPAMNTFWSGGLRQVAPGSLLDFTSAAAYEWWQTQVKTALLDYGIDVTWNDNNEFEIGDDAAECDGFGKPIPLSLARPLQTLLMVKASVEATQAHKPDARPFALTRSASPGMQRYAQTWSGDNMTSWHTLRWNLPMGLSLSLSGMPNTGHDIGGFFGPAPEPELFIRWAQVGAFFPRFSIHSWNSDGTVNEPWMYPEALPHIRAAIQFRYRLMPYLYALMHEAAATGHPIMRPLVYHFPDDPRCRAESFDFMLGAHLLVAPVTEARARSRLVYLPEGSDWCDFYSGHWYEGGETVEVEAPLDHIPLFARANAIIPMSSSEDADARTLYLFPHPDSGFGAFSLSEDDGETFAYRDGGLTLVRLNLVSLPGSVTIAATMPQHGYPLPYNRIDVALPKGETRPMKYVPLVEVGVSWGTLVQP
jgi:alpha-glucosidase